MPVLVVNLRKLIKINCVLYQLSERILFITIGNETKSSSLYELDKNHFKSILLNLFNTPKSKKKCRS